VKTGLVAVILWADSKAVGGANLDRIVSDAAETVAEGGLLRPVVVVSLHSSPVAADKAAARIAEMLKPCGWWLADGSAENEARNQEGNEDES